MASRKSPLSLFSALLLACASLTQHATAAPYPQPEPQQNVQWVTSIWTDTLTQTHTSIYSIAAAVPTGGPDCVPNTSLGESACGNICCAASQKCQYAGQCMERGPNDAPYLGSTLGGHTYTTQYSAPYRPTSGATGTAASATASSTGGAAGGAAGGGTADTGLSGGEIAGIVIGTLAGVVLLLLLCACCIVRGLWHGFLAIFGIGGNKRSKETVVEEERYARHSGRRDSHGSWYAGGRPSGAGARKESSGKGLMGAGAALGTLWLLLGMKKDKKKESSKRKSRSENSSYYYSDYTSSGSPSKFQPCDRQAKTMYPITNLGNSNRLVQ